MCIPQRILPDPPPTGLKCKLDNQWRPLRSMETVAPQRQPSLPCPILVGWVIGDQVAQGPGGGAGQVLTTCCLYFLQDAGA